ncbi:hypothetical protein GGG16DRAFT_102132 [Schizophyllum commune]
MVVLSATALLAHAALVFAARLEQGVLSVRERNDGIHLAVGPSCGSLTGTVSDVNAGIDTSKIKTVVAFGDSYTDGGKDDGSPLDPPVLVPPNTEAGGRSTDGPTWVEYVAQDLGGATLKDYAQWGACIDLSIWPSNPRKVDFLGQMDTFLGQSNALDPDSTLYVVFFGINDYEASKTDGDHMQEAANVLLNQLHILASAPTSARNFLVADVYGRGVHTASGEAFKQTIYDGLAAMHGENGTSVAYVDFSAIWDGVLGSDPGYAAFGYTSTDACTECTTDCDQYGWCKDWAHWFYWIGGHPSTQTMRIMADLVSEVLKTCVVG